MFIIYYDMYSNKPITFIPNVVTKLFLLPNYVLLQLDNIFFTITFSRLSFNIDMYIITTIGITTFLYILCVHTYTNKIQNHFTDLHDITMYL